MVNPISQPLVAADLVRIEQFAMPRSIPSQKGYQPKCLPCGLGWVGRIGHASEARPGAPRGLPLSKQNVRRQTPRSQLGIRRERFGRRCRGLVECQHISRNQQGLGYPAGRLGIRANIQDPRQTQDAMRVKPHPVGSKDPRYVSLVGPSQREKRCCESVQVPNFLQQGTPIVVVLIKRPPVFPNPSLGSLEHPAPPLPSCGQFIRYLGKNLLSHPATQPAVGLARRQNKRPRQGDDDGCQQRDGQEPNSNREQAPQGLCDLLASMPSSAAFSAGTAREPLLVSVYRVHLSLPLIPGLLVERQNLPPTVAMSQPLQPVPNKHKNSVCGAFGAMGHGMDTRRPMGEAP